MAFPQFLRQVLHACIDAYMSGRWHCCPSRLRLSLYPSTLRRRGGQSSAAAARSRTQVSSRLHCSVQHEAQAPPEPRRRTVRHRLTTAYAYEQCLAPCATVPFYKAARTGNALRRCCVRPDMRMERTTHHLIAEPPAPPPMTNYVPRLRHEPPNCISRLPYCAPRLTAALSYRTCPSARQYSGKSGRQEHVATARASASLAGTFHASSYDPEDETHSPWLLLRSMPFVS